MKTKIKNAFKKAWIVIKLISPAAFKFWIAEFKKEWKNIEGKK